LKTGPFEVQFNAMALSMSNSILVWSVLLGPGAGAQFKGIASHIFLFIKGNSLFHTEDYSIYGESCISRKVYIMMT
jgi:hypothetical protein